METGTAAEFLAEVLAPKHLTADQVRELYRNALQAAEQRLFATRIGVLSEPDNADGRKEYAAAKRHLAAIEADVDQWERAQSAGGPSRNGKAALAAAAGAGRDT